MRAILLGLVLGCILCAPTASADAPRLQRIQDQLQRLYTVSEREPGDPVVDHTGYEPFQGNCIDYYAAAFQRLRAEGYEPWGVAGWTREGIHHVVACVRGTGHDTYCLDNTSRDLLTLSEARKRYLNLRVRFNTLKVSWAEPQ